MQNRDEYEHFGQCSGQVCACVQQGGDVRVGRFRVISGIYVTSRPGLSRGEIDVNSEERGQAYGQMLSA